MSLARLTCTGAQGPSQSKSFGGVDMPDLPVDNQGAGKSVADYGQQNRAVVQQDLFRTTARIFLVNEVEITENAVENKRNRVLESVSAELGNSVIGNGVEHVGNECAGRYNRDHVIEQLGAVFMQDFTMMHGVVFQQHQFVAALAQRQKQRKQQCTEEKPG